MEIDSLCILLIQIPYAKILLLDNYNTHKLYCKHPLFMYNYTL